MASLVDLDGDGLRDYVDSIGAGNWTWWRNLGRIGFADGEDWVPVSGSDEIASFVDDAYDRVLEMVVDVNGDGRADHVKALSASAVQVGINQRGAPSPLAKFLSTSGWAADLATPGGGFGLSEIYTRATFRRSTRAFLDLNGDDLPDLVDESSGGGCSGLYYTVAFNLGFTWQRAAGTGHEKKVQTICHSNPNGNLGFGREENPAGGPTRWHGQTALVDVNADGVVDILASIGAVTSQSWEVYYGLGDGSFAPQGISFSVPTSGIPLLAGQEPTFGTHLTDALGEDHPRSFRDMDGDGILDWVAADRAQTDFFIYHQTQGGEPAKPGSLLESVETELGAVFEYSWLPAREFAGEAAGTQVAPEVLPATVRAHGRPLWVLANEIIWDGRSGTAELTTEHAYAEFRYNTTNREFLGARMTEEIDAVGTVVRSFFHQVPTLRSRMAYQEVHPLSGEPLAAEETSWGVFPVANAGGAAVSGSFFALPAQTKQRERDSGGSSFTIESTEAYAYDIDPVNSRVRYGHLVRRLDFGADNDDGTADDLETTLQYAPNAPINDPSVYLVAYPYRIIEKDGNGGILSELELDYEPSEPDPNMPKDGLVREEVVHADFPGQPPELLRTKRVFDAFGNVTAVHRPLHLASDPSATVSYDASYKTFPDLIERKAPIPTNPNAIHRTRILVDAKTGDLLKRLEPNLYLECWTYDVLGELDNHKHALGQDEITDSCPTTLEEFDFQFRGTPGQQRTETRRFVASGNFFRDYEYLDGLGRTFYEASAKTGAVYYSTVHREWGARGELICERLPRTETILITDQRCSTGPGAGRLFGYDALLRQSNVALDPDLSSSGPTQAEESIVYRVSDSDGVGPPLTFESVEVHTFHGSPPLSRETGRNPRGAVVSVKEDGTLLTLLKRDPKDRLLSVDGPNVALEGGETDQNLIELEYDSADRRRVLRRPRYSGETPPRERWQYAWDQNGNLKTETTPDGKQIRYEYDRLDRLVLKDLFPFASPPSAGTEDYALVYDTPLADLNPGNDVNNIGHVSEIRAPTVPTRFQRSRRWGLPLVQQVDVPGVGGFGSAFTYDNQARMKLRVFADGQGISYLYDAAALSSVLLSTKAEVDAHLLYGQPLVGWSLLGSITTHANGRVESFRHVDPDIDVSWTFPEDKGQRPGRISAVNSQSQLIQDLTLEYDASGNVLSIADAVRGRSQYFGYDGRHRLVSANDTHPQGHGTQSFSYDAAGNRLDEGGTTLSYGAGTAAPDAVTKLGVTPFSYDGRGNRSPLGQLGPGATWTDDSRLKNTTLFGSSHDLHYDFDGRRTRITGGSVYRIYADPGYESDLATNRHTKHVFLGGQRQISIEQDMIGTDTSQGTGTITGEVHFFPDHLGSTDVTTNATGGAGQAYFYSPYGKFHFVDLQGTPLLTAPTRYLFAQTERLDGSQDIHYAQARYYDATTGRFLSEDPALVGPAGTGALMRIAEAPQFQNAYAYALNLPTGLMDRSGLQPEDPDDAPWEIILVVLGFGSLLGGDGGSGWEELIGLRYTLALPNSIDTPMSTASWGEPSNAASFWPVIIKGAEIGIRAGIAACARSVQCASRVAAATRQAYNLIRAATAGGAAARVDPNKLHHIFGKAGHNLAPLVQRFGSQESAYIAVANATQTAPGCCRPKRLERAGDRGERSGRWGWR